MYEITFTDQQLAVLNDALVQMPYRLAAPLIAHINEQIQKQREQAPSDKGA